MSSCAEGCLPDAAADAGRGLAYVTPMTLEQVAAIELVKNPLRHDDDDDESDWLAPSSSCTCTDSCSSIPTLDALVVTREDDFNSGFL